MDAQDSVEPIFQFEGGSLCAFEGPVVVRYPSTEFVAEGQAIFDWYSGTRLLVTAAEIPPTPWFEEPHFEIPDGRFLADPIALNVNPPDRTFAFEAILSVTHAVRGSLESPIQSLTIHLCNIPPTFLEEPDPQRLNLSTQDWSVLIQEVEDARAKYERVRTRGGGEITHLLILERADSKPFLYEDVRHLEDALRHLLSFALGRRIAFLLPVGTDSGGTPAFALWGDPQRHVHTSGLPWFSRNRSSSLRQLWPGLLRTWNQPEGRDMLKVAIGLYTDASHGPLLEPKLILAYAGLDLLAWYWLREEARLSRKELKSLGAEGRLRETLERISVPVAIPQDLGALAAEFEGSDGPGALNQMRNRIAHPKAPKRILSTSNATKFDAWRLALWYFDLILLHICDFAGHYLSRVQPPHRWEFETEAPPWVTADSVERLGAEKESEISSSSGAAVCDPTS